MDPIFLGHRPPPRNWSGRSWHLAEGMGKKQKNWVEEVSDNPYKKYNRNVLSEGCGGPTDAERRAIGLKRTLFLVVGILRSVSREQEPCREPFPVVCSVTGVISSARTTKDLTRREAGREKVGGALSASGRLEPSSARRRCPGASRRQRPEHRRKPWSFRRHRCRPRSPSGCRRRRRHSRRSRPAGQRAGQTGARSPNASRPSD